MPKYFTKEGLDKLEKELAYLQDVKRKEISERIRHTAAQGDLKENAAYHMAKDEQGFTEGRIRELKDVLSQAEVIKGGKGETVEIGSTVFLKSKDEESKYQIVGPEEADIMCGKISFKSPLGEAIFGKKKGDVVKFETVDGPKEFKIVSIS
jgi:transcription elongation factor GreA